MIPGTAVGVMVGDLIFTAMAFRLARRSGRTRRDRDAAGARHAEYLRRGLLNHRPGVPGGARGRGLEPLAAAEHAWFLGIAMILASGRPQARLCPGLAAWSAGSCRGRGCSDRWRRSRW